MRLRCRVSARCPWKIDDETHDSDGQRHEHERECARFCTSRAEARRLADHLEAERNSHLFGRAA